MKEIYNEGRVVGLSAYEIYVRHFLSEFPDKPILTERDWLSSTLGNGSSMILRIVAGTSEGIHDYPLPENSTICAAQTITASMFNGEADVNGLWGIRVTSYGPLLSNTASSSPITPGEQPNELPHSDLDLWDKQNLHILREYMKIIDGLAIQPGTWNPSNLASPAKELTPKLNENGIIRLRITKPLEEDVYVLLTGFIHTPLLSGFSKIETSSVNTPKPENGDFLGCEVFPWASKIVFTVPSEVFNALNTKAYVREFPDNSEEKSVESHAVVDFETTDPKDFYVKYKEQYQGAQIDLDVKDINVIGSGVSVLGTYQRPDSSNGYTGADYPPVLYGAKATETGLQKMSPIDIAAPGTVKVFEDKDLALNYPRIYPNIYSLYNSQEGDIYIIDGETDETDLVPITTKVSVVNNGTYDAPQYIATVRARDDRTDMVVERAICAVSMKDTNDTALNPAGSKSSSYSDTNGTVKDDTWLNGANGLSWEILLNALGVDKKIELLGVPLRTFRSKLPDIVSGEGGVLNILGTGQSKIAGSLAVNGASNGSNALTDDDEFKFNKPIKSGDNYIVFSNGLRLYIAKNQPTDTDVPIGSIGIGWGLATD